MMMFLILTTFLAGALSKDYRSDFNKAFAKFHVSDGLLMSEPPQVAAQRYKSFVHFAEEVDAVNGDDDIPFMAENNFLSILTPEEREAHMGFNSSGHMDSGETDYAAEERLVRRDIPASRDFSDRISGVKNQGSCGSCWTFAATAALEGEMYFVNSKKGMSLSEQEYMECSTSSDGCQGGWMEDCYTYSKKQDRIAPTSAAPYKGKDSRKCNYGNVANALASSDVRVTGNIEIKGDAKLLEFASKHIVSVAVKVSNKFMVYKSGVMVDNSCNKQPDHAVAVVGYGVEKGRKYWKVRNSWGVGWGDKGYILMDREKQNMCMISTYSHIPKVECRGSKCTAANADDESDDDSDDDSDDSDDGDDDDSDHGGDDETKLCKKRIGLFQKCKKNEAKAKEACENNSIPNCAIMKMNKNCYYIESGKTNNQRYIEVMMPCEEKDEKDEKCDSAAGLVFCSDCNCCKHEHMCHDKK
ncbi:digestive cysteine proteinase 3-like [Bolinopsis microptera]|uniref:digestive cysteine proteinase 3-like n=1 Tax=Bolinopsis microptera TaxID=2820187 RepID=UPI00307A9F21